MSRAKCIMVQGTMSGAGKSLLCTALCRIFAQDGYRVAPFKSQNMALNSFVTRDGLEMGRAQVVQAQAAGMEPDVRMNPILLKPSSDVGSQVIVNGEVRGQMPAAAYFKLKKSLIPDILAAYDSLAEEVDIIVIEGAGSPAEINLKADDIVNMGLAELVDAPVLLAGDIDRGGVFAQLYGTVELLEPAERARIKGLIINKFRGDAAILKPGLTMLEEKTHLPVLGVVPYLRVDIEDEDSLSSRLESSTAVKPLDAAILRLPHISNFTDFMPLEQHPLLSVRYVQSPRQLGAPDVVILPGTKNTIDDLLWLRQCGLEATVQKLATSGTPVLGVCGGFLLFSKGFNAVSYVATVILTLISSWIMVSVSIRKPVKIAAGISPIEAVRFTPAQKDIRSRKKNIKLNPISMGIANFKRDRKKTVAIVASLSLGGIILLVVSSIVLLRSPEALARQFFPDGDYKIYLDSEMTEEKVMAAGNPLSEELEQEILSIDGVTDIIPSRQSLHATYKTEIHQAGGMCDMLTDQNYAAVEAALTEGTMPTDSRSIVIDYNVLKQNEDMGVGSTVEISLGEEQPSVSVTISGLYAPAKVYSGHGRMHLDGATLFAPEALFHELHPEITSFDYSWSIVNDPKKTDYVGAELKNIVASHSNIALDEINTVIGYEEMTNSFAFGSMEILSWLVFLFGVINLINTTLSNQIARKQENSILRSIGLTQKQLCEMNICEGLCYALFATLATLIVGLPASIFACRKMSIGAFAGNVVPYKFPVLEMGLFILVLFGMELILSVWTIRRQKKQSLIEQMRAME